MTRRVGNVQVLERETPMVCSVCGETVECRPYGPGGRPICIICVKKPEHFKEAVIRTTDRWKGVTKIVRVVEVEKGAI